MLDDVLNVSLDLSITDESGILHYYLLAALKKAINDLRKGEAPSKAEMYWLVHLLARTGIIWDVDSQHDSSEVLTGIVTHFSGNDYAPLQYSPEFTVTKIEEDKTKKWLSPSFRSLYEYLSEHKSDRLVDETVKFFSKDSNGKMRKKSSFSIVVRPENEEIQDIPFYSSGYGKSFLNAFAKLFSSKETNEEDKKTVKSKASIQTILDREFGKEELLGLEGNVDEHEIQEGNRLILFNEQEEVIGTMTPTGWQNHKGTKSDEEAFASLKCASAKLGIMRIGSEVIVQDKEKPFEQGKVITITLNPVEVGNEEKTEYRSSKTHELYDEIPLRLEIPKEENKHLELKAVICRSGQTRRKKIHQTVTRYVYDDSGDLVVENGKALTYKEEVVGGKEKWVSSGNAGHYIQFSKIEGQWYCYNDDRVSKMSEEEVLDYALSIGYSLSYEIVNNSDDE